jgi:hypothetical protein
MAVLWFACEAIESTRGFAAYELPIHTIAAKLEGEGNFQFLSPLHRSPITSLGRSGEAVDYRFVVWSSSMSRKLRLRTGGLASIKSRLVPRRSWKS